MKKIIDLRFRKLKFTEKIENLPNKIEERRMNDGASEGDESKLEKYLITFKLLNFFLILWQ